MRLSLVVALLGHGFAKHNGAHADEVSYSFDGDTLPQGDGWDVYNPCETGSCQESLSDGHFVLVWTELGGGDFVNYTYVIAAIGEEPPPTLWVEFRLRSNRPLGPIYYLCDAHSFVQFRECNEWIHMYGDTVLSGSANDVVSDLPLDEFYTLRFRSLNGTDFDIAVDGRVFTDGINEHSGTGASFLQIQGHGGCPNEILMSVRNEWDFVRYGTISFGERIVASDPPTGFLDPSVNFDRFIVTYDSPNYAYVDDINVEVSGGEAPQVIATKRVDNGPSEVLQIILDRPLPAGERTTFTFDDGTVVNTVSYTFQLGDADADSDWDILDFAHFQNCFASPPCPAFDFHEDPETVEIDLDDFALFFESLTGPQP